MLTELIELGQKKNKWRIPNIQGTNSDRKETRSQSNDLEQKEKINIQQNEETRIQKSEETLTNLWDNLKHWDIQIIGVPEGAEEDQEIENLLEPITKENFPIWWRK